MDNQKTIGQQIVEGLQEFAEALKNDECITNRFTCRTVELRLTPTVYQPALVKATRQLLGASQTIFAQFLGVSVSTVQSWERGENTPNDMACRFMDEIRHQPEYWKERLLEMVVPKECV